MQKIKVLALGALAVAGVLAIATLTVGNAGEKHIICHFDGQAGTTKFQRIECGSGCVNGHFINNTTPKAGHELDILDPPGGLCPDEPGPTPTPTPTPTPGPTP